MEIAQDAFQFLPVFTTILLATVMQRKDCGTPNHNKFILYFKYDLEGYNLLFCYTRANEADSEQTFTLAAGLEPVDFGTKGSTVPFGRMVVIIRNVLSMNKKQCFICIFIPKVIGITTE